MQVKIENIETKNIINFYLPSVIFSEQIAVLVKPETKHSLLQNIMAIDGVDRCLATNSLISVRFANNAVLDDAKMLVLAEIDDYLEDRKQIIDIENTAPVLETSEALADAIIRPTLNRDKGDILISGFLNGVLNLQFTGHCAGCPYAQNTLQNVIAKNLQRYIPQIKNVCLKE